MISQVIKGLAIPFAGTVLGAASIMTSAAIWSLLLPAMKETAHLDKMSGVHVAAAFWVGIFFLFILDKVTP